MKSNHEVAEQLRAQADEFAISSERLSKLADEIDPPSDDDLIERDIGADNDAMWTLFVRVYNLVAENPGITINKIASVMGLPGNYPSENSHHFTAQILHWLMHQGLVYRNTAKKPYEWMANAVSTHRPSLRLVEDWADSPALSEMAQPQLPTAPQALQKSQPSLRITV